jgi:hypothetical protein
MPCSRKSSSAVETIRSLGGMRSSEAAMEISFESSDFFADEVLDIDVTDR